MTAPLDEKGLLDRICHKEQIGIWANEVLTALSLGDFLREEWSFDDTVDAEREIEAQLRSIIASAISHPEYDLMAKITAAEAQVLRLTEENEALRKERTSLIETKRAQLEGLGKEAFTLRNQLDAARKDAAKWLGLHDATEARAEAAEAQAQALRELAERLKLEAQGHASEARTANSTIYEIYQVLSGGKGEPGNWHGAEPARRYVEAAEARIKALEEGMERIAAIAERNYGRQNEKLADIAPIARRALSQKTRANEADSTL